jgi:hypothetical protein
MRLVTNDVYDDKIVVVDFGDLTFDCPVLLSSVIFVAQNPHTHDVSDVNATWLCSDDVWTTHGDLLRSSMSVG